MSENNSFHTPENNEQATQENRQESSIGTSNPAYSDITYTYNADASYRTNLGDQKKQPKKRNGSGCFVAVIAVLLCITIAAAGISIYSIFFTDDNGNNPGTLEASPTATTDSSSGSTNSAFENLVQVNPSPTPELIEGELLTPQQAAQKVIPSVVCIQCYTTNSNYGGSASSALYSEGSSIICRSDGYIITNAHVIEDASTVQVVLYDGTIYDAEIIGSDTITDLALLKIDPADKEITAANFSSAKNCQVADTVLAVGNPGGLNFSSSVTQGIISALNRAVQDESTGYVMYCIQTDTAINPGNSGGPLIDLYGNVIGITSSKIVATEYENMGFAITYDDAAPIINDLLNYGHVKDRAAINITLTLPSNIFRITGWNSIPTGLCIITVSGEEERNAGLKQYDIIYAIDGNQITSMADYSSYLLTKKPGDKVSLTIYRATVSGWSVQYSNTPITVEITLSEAT